LSDIRAAPEMAQTHPILAVHQNPSYGHRLFTSATDRFSQFQSVNARFRLFVD
jgi:hypothetical protein